MAAHKQDLGTRFWSYVEKSDGCWLWTGARDAAGYGIFQLEGKARRAHRIAYDLTHEIPLGNLFACHHCDNPLCVRPDHVFPGTAADNAADRDSKGRLRHPKGRQPGTRFGEQHPQTKLTQQQVDDIRARFVPHNVSCRKLAAEYGVSKSTIFNIVKGKTW